MKNNDVIEPSSSSWASPIVLVMKKDCLTRFRVDYRRLNGVTKKDSYPLPRIDDTLDTLAGNTWFSTLDLKSGYWQDALISAPILAYPEIGKQFILDTDVSHESIGDVLSQEIDGQEHVIAYFSKCLFKPERIFCVTRKELLAIGKAVEHFHPYLYGRRFLLRTDHASFSWLVNFKNSEGQIARWIKRLQEYDVEIRHRKGSAHGNAGALLRRPCPESCKYCSRIEKKFSVIGPIVRQETTPSTSALDPWSDESVRKDQLADPEIKPIMEFKEPSDEKPSWQDISLFHPTTKSYWALWDSLHPSNGPRKRTRGRLQLYNVGVHFERIAFNILSPLPRSSDGNKNILVVMDYLTKWHEAYPIPDQEASTVAEVLVQHWISQIWGLFATALR
ncbi:retrovirus-related Pol polyprotein from transposon 412 [Trichonephila clavipes]|nr:retrovirus-related Pol polyprotein from transposon 412 [Trichonephila clavipes]